MDRSVRTARNALFNLLGSVYPILVTIILTPVFLHYVGIVGYGVYALALAFVSLLTLLEIGFGIAIMKHLPQHIAHQDHGEAVRLIRSAIAFYGLVATVGLIAAALTAFVLLDPLFRVPHHLASEARIAVLLAGVAFALTMLMSPFGGVVASFQAFEVVAKTRVATTTIGAATSVGLLAAGAGLTGLMIGVALQPALALLLYARAARGKLPGLRMAPQWDVDILRQLVSFSLYTAVGSISGVLLFQLDKVVLGAIGGVALVTFYVVPAALAQRLHTAATTITSVALPAASDLFARDELRSIHTLYSRAMWLTALFLASVGTPAAVFAPNILEHWVGSSFAERSSLPLVILVVTYFLLGLAALPYWMSLAAERPRVGAVFNVLTAIINVCAIFLLIPKYDVVGAALAYLVSMSTVPGFIWYVERRVLGIASSPWPAIVRRLTVVLAVQTPLCLVLRPFADTLLSTIGLVLFCIVAAPVILIALGLVSQEDRRLMRRILGRRSASPPGAVA